VYVVGKFEIIVCVEFESQIPDVRFDGITGH